MTGRGAKLCIANWKMKVRSRAAAALLTDLTHLTTPELRKQLWVAAPTLYLTALANTPPAHGIRFGIQNCHGAVEGPCTGEVSVGMAKDAGATFTLIGHSECRHQFGETDPIIKERLRGVVQQGFPVVYCIGETAEESTTGSRRAVLTRQLQELLSLLAGANSEILVAYEPVWAIGSGVTPSSDQIEETHQEIHAILGDNVGTRVPVLYGGSVTPENITSIVELSSVDGVLVGGASTSAPSLAQIMHGCAASMAR